ncbi:MAG: PAS domain S-box protein [Chitinispirillaceae bacterium]|nr:PAS domain S-box protein [Chitinispirillaceae bacterium]
MHIRVLPATCLSIFPPDRQVPNRFGPTLKNNHLHAISTGYPLMKGSSPPAPDASPKNNGIVITALLFSVLTILMIVLTYNVFRSREQTISRDIQNNLSAIADLKAEQIILWCKERREDAEMIAADVYLAQRFKLLHLHPSDTTTRNELNSILGRITRLKEYCSAQLIDTSGRILLGTAKYQTFRNLTYSDTVSFHTACTSRRVVLSDLHRDGDSLCSAIHLTLFVPISDPDSNLIGVVLLNLDPSRFLFPLIQSWPTPSTTAEVLLIREENGNVLFLNELRHRKNTALTLRLPLSAPELPAAMALSGTTGAISGKDYRGMPVLAVVRSIPQTSWFMVAKIDRSEALGEVRHAFRRAVVVLVLLIFIIGLSAILYQRHRSSRTYKKLYLSEREKASLASTLAASEKRFKRLFESMTEGVALHDIIFDENGKPCNYRIVTINPAYEHHTGLSLERTRGKLATELYGTETPPYFEEFSTVVLTGTPYRFETYFPPLEKHFSISVFSPGTNQFATVFEDITARKTADDKLRESEERFRRIFEDGMFGMAIVDKSFSFLKVNAAFCSMVGYTEEELQSRTFGEITHPDHRSGDITQVKQVMQGNLPFYKTEKRYIRKDGETVWGSVIITTLRDKDGTFQYFLAMIENITDRKHAEEALVAEKERLLVTLRSIGDAVIATDVSGRIVLMNKVAESLTGWEFSEAEGKPLSEVFVIINERTRQPCESPVEKVLTTGSIVTLANHTVLIGRDGCERVIADSGAPIKDRRSVTIGVVLVFRDNTEKEKTQEALQKAQQLESLGVLAGGIAHDFNNLLGGLFGYLDLARESIADDESVRYNLDKAFSVFGRAKDLTAQLLTFAKGGAPSRKVTALAPLLRETVQFALSGSSISTEFVIDSALRKCSVDQHQICQVIDNLIINARDAMPRGGVITISAINATDHPAVLSPGDYVYISISDQGTGIPPEHLAHIFDPFFTTKQKGSGLGLAVSYSIISRHDGTLTATSEHGKGTTMHLYLPAAKETAHTLSTSTPTITDHKGDGTILLMDDEDYIRDIASAMLKSMGYDTVSATCGEETIRIFSEADASGKKFILTILDLTIPGGMGGKATMEKLRKIDPDCRIVASSGYSDDPIIAHPNDYGFTGSIRKPYRKAELSELLDKIIPGV